MSLASMTGSGPAEKRQGQNMKRSTTTGLVAGLIAMVAIGAVARPALAIETIDCDKDTRIAERTICSSQRLQILDAIVVQAYADVMLDAVVSERIKNRVKWSQRAFLRDRDRCGDDRRCLEASMQGQLERLRRSVN